MLTIIGCGNLNRSDDAVGVVIAQNLQEFLLKYPASNVRIYDCGTAGIEVMFQAQGSQKLIIIDACSTNSSPGTIFEVPGEELENLPAPSYNLHDFRWDHALAAGRKIFKNNFPQEVIVYLIEAKNLTLGLELTPPIRQAATVVLEKLKKQIINR
jgi:hydrogenase maturation protease